VSAVRSGRELQGLGSRTFCLVFPIDEVNNGSLRDTQRRHRPPDVDEWIWCGVCVWQDGGDISRPPSLTGTTKIQRSIVYGPKQICALVDDSGFCKRWFAAEEGLDDDVVCIGRPDQHRREAQQLVSVLPPQKLDSCSGSVVNLRHSTLRRRR
jgi:hypothetical protein